MSRIIILDSTEQIHSSSTYYIRTNMILGFTSLENKNTKNEQKRKKNLNLAKLLTGVSIRDREEFSQKKTSGVSIRDREQFSFAERHIKDMLDEQTMDLKECRDETINRLGHHMKFKDFRSIIDNLIKSGDITERGSTLAKA
jgi:hypothetical protein